MFILLFEAFVVTMIGPEVNDQVDHEFCENFRTEFKKKYLHAITFYYRSGTLRHPFVNENKT